MRSVPRTSHQSQPDRARLVRELLDNVHAQRRRLGDVRGLPWAFGFYLRWIVLAATWPAADVEPLLGRTHHTFGVRRQTATADLAVARAAIAEQSASGVRLRTQLNDLDRLFKLTRGEVRS